MIDSAKAAELAGKLDDALAAYERAFDHSRGRGCASDVAAILRWIGSVRRARGDVELALELFEASLAVAEANGLAPEEVAALNCLAIAEQGRGEMDRAAALYLRGATLAGSVGDVRLVAMIEQNRGALANVQGRFAQAFDHYGTALALARDVGDEVTISHTLNNIGMTHLDVEQWEAAEQCFDEAFSLAEGREDLALVGTVALNRAELHLNRRRLDEGRVACERALGVFNKLRSKPSVGEAYKLSAMLYRGQGNAALADAYFASALGLAETSEDLLLQAEVQVEWASLHLERRRWQLGITYLNRSLRAFGQLNARREILDIERRLERAESIYIEAVRTWSADMEAVAGIPKGHAERVVDLACALARRIGIAGWELTTLRVGGLVHDVGCAGVRRGKATGPAVARLLTRAEPIAGDALTRELDFPLEVRQVVRSSRECWDGSGYPDRLAGTAIPIGARLIAIADMYDGLTQPAPGKPRLHAGEALNAIHAAAGTLVDPVLVDQLAGLLRERNLAAA